MITNTTRAAITGTTGRSGIDAGGAVSLSAKDTSEINTLAIGVSAAGGGAVGAAVAANVITNTVTTEIDNTDLDTLSSLALTSESAAIIRTLSLGVSYNSVDFDFIVADRCPDGHVITFTLSITANEGSWTTTFNVSVVHVLPPAPPPVLEQCRYQNGTFLTRVQTYTGYDYTMQKSTDLDAWKHVITRAGTGSIIEFEDPNAGNSMRAYYRVFWIKK